jgi:hypothetical protein
VPLVDFDIESYVVRISHPATRPSFRKITLTGPALDHGIRIHAVVGFYDDPPEQFGIVRNVNPMDYIGHNVHAWLPKVDFNDWYDVLRNEAPLLLQYRYDPDAYDVEHFPYTRKLTFISLFTGSDEPPGEGPDDLMEPLLAELARSAPAAEGSDESTPASQ